MIYQDPASSLDPRMNMMGIVAEPLAVTRMSTEQRQQRVVHVLGMVGLGPSLATRYPHELSGGQQQRVAIARALARVPDLVVADEAVSSLDVSLQAQVLNVLKEVQGSIGWAMLFISHDIAAVRFMSDRILVMYRGAIVESAPSQMLFAVPHHPYTAALREAVLRGGVRQKPSDVPIAAQEDSATLGVSAGCRFRARCPIARAVCAEVEPRLVEHTKAHWVACHFPDGVALPQRRADVRTFSP
jgi:oligopeptide/dipeptide ABC transporter ATP-binding protein